MGGAYCLVPPDGDGVVLVGKARIRGVEERFPWHFSDGVCDAVLRHVSGVPKPGHEGGSLLFGIVGGEPTHVFPPYPARRVKDLGDLGPATLLSPFPDTVKRELPVAAPLAAMVRIPASKLSADEKTLLQTWRTAFPRQAYASGFREHAGTVPLPHARTDAQVEATLERLGQSEDESIAAAATSLAAAHRFREPFVPIEQAVWAYQTHLVLEGPKNPHLAALNRCVAKSFPAWAAAVGKEASAAQRLFLGWHTHGFRTLIASLQRSLPPRLHPGLRSALEAMERYVKPFDPPACDGSFEQSYPLLDASDGFARPRHYPEFLRDLYALPETPTDVEEAGAKLLREELANLRRLTGELAAAYDCQAEPRIVKRELARARNGHQGGPLAVTGQLRELLAPVARKHLVAVTTRYQTNLVETPSYLEATLPTAAAAGFGLFTEKPFNYYFLTTGEGRAAPSGFPELYQTLAHEEFGHCVHFSNSATLHGPYKPRLAELLPTPLGRPMSEGISFNMEWMSVDLLRSLLGSPARDRREDALITFATQRTKPDRLLLESEFEVAFWRVLRFLRAVGDVRLNLHGEKPLRFLEWAERETGIGKKTVFDQVVTFQDSPGYAPCYAMAGDRFRRLLQRAEHQGTPRKAFNTYVSCLGYPAQRLFEKRVRKHFS